MASWVEAVTEAIRRHVAASGSTTFTRQVFIETELLAIVAATGTSGLTPAQTLGRELQQLRDTNRLDFVAPGTYRWLGEVPRAAPVWPTNLVFVLEARADEALPERGFTFAREWSALARRSIDQWVIYQEGGGYIAAARVERIGPLPGDGETWLARIRTNDFVEFTEAIALEDDDGHVIERGLIGTDGRIDRARAAQRIRTISDHDVDRILQRALGKGDEILPRSDGAGLAAVMDKRVPYEAPVDRATILTSRKVRDAQFRGRVLKAYRNTCALTGLEITNGGGRAETEAAHIKSVAAGGPDSLNNGIALSSTMHWMFDRGLVTLRDDGKIVLSRAINDVDRVKRLIHPDGWAWLPSNPHQRPHPRYLDWHRTNCFHD